MSDHPVFSQLYSSKPSECELKEVHEPELESVQNLLNRFDSLSKYSMVVISEAYSVFQNNRKSYLPLLSLNFTTRNTKIPQNISNFTEYEMVGLATLQKDYGLVLIRPESWVDKITEIINPIEIDFAMDEEFSDRFYVLTNDNLKLAKTVNKKFLETLKKYEGPEIEIAGNVLLARFHKTYTPENAEFMMKFMLEINDGIN